MKRLCYLVILAILPISVFAQSVSFTNPDIEVKFKRCICTGTVAYIDLLMTNYSGKTMTPYCGHLDKAYAPDNLFTRVYDDEGNEYIPTVKIGNDYHQFPETSGTKNAFYIIDNKEKSIIVRIPANEKTSEVSLPKSDLTTLLENKVDIKGGGDIQTYFGRKYRTQPDSYVYVLYNELVKKAVPLTKTKSVAPVSEKKFVFIIDEINRGEISKIFGELFFSVDPGYRGKKGRVQTQYQNLITDETDPFKEGFYIPENVYIIGTMNDIDRSVECMDFAMRRRFTFKEITAEESASNMELGAEATERMMSLNNAISNIDGFNSSFHIGAAYFKGVDDFDALWELKLAGLLKEYLRGMPNAAESFEALKKAYDLNEE